MDEVEEFVNYVADNAVDQEKVAWLMAWFEDYEAL